MKFSKELGVGEIIWIWKEFECLKECLLFRTNLKNKKNQELKVGEYQSPTPPQNDFVSKLA